MISDGTDDSGHFEGYCDTDVEDTYCLFKKLIQFEKRVRFSWYDKN